MFYCRSSLDGTSISSDTYLPFFFLCLTHSDKRYSICPFTDRKSSSAQAAIASYNFGESLKGTCFLVLSVITNTDFPNSQPVVHHDFHRAQPEDWKPLQLFVPHPVPQPDFHLSVPVPFLPCRPLRPQSSFWHQ